jgi:hypothetical protein
MKEYQIKKNRIIPLVVSGEINCIEAARLIGCTRQTVMRLRDRYRQYGPAGLIHGNTGHRPWNSRINLSRIADDYIRRFNGAPFGSYRDMREVLLGDSVSYSTVYRALTSHGIISPRARVPVREKKKHLPRAERPREGELVQIDGSTHDWFMCGKKTSLHGMVDDATHSIIALYMCENECLLGYYRLLAQCVERTGGVPRAIYSDRSSCFFVTRESLDRVSIQEQLAGSEKKRTQWQQTCSELGIELIAAHSPQAKGRIERLWQTLQERLPYIFRFLHIDTIERANDFLKGFITEYNSRFAVPAQDPERVWLPVEPSLDLDSLFAVKTHKKTKADGTFVYHGYKFRLCAKRAACVPFTLCLSEAYGIKALVKGLYYDVELAEPLCDVVGDSMPIVEKDLLYRYLLADTHSNLHYMRC